jgi:hypothetical protein
MFAVNAKQPNKNYQKKLQLNGDCVMSAVTQKLEVCLVRTARKNQQNVFAANHLVATQNFAGLAINSNANLNG